MSEKKQTNNARQSSSPAPSNRVSPLCALFARSLGSDDKLTGLLESVCTNACLSVLTSGSASMALSMEHGRDEGRERRALAGDE